MFSKIVITIIILCTSTLLATFVTAQESATTPSTSTETSAGANTSSVATEPDGSAAPARSEEDAPVPASTTTPDTTDTGDNASAAAEPLPEEVPANALARVNNDFITLQDFASHLNETSNGNVLEGLISHVLVETNIENSAVTVTDREVLNRIKVMEATTFNIKDLTDEEALLDILKKNGMDFDTFVVMVRQNIKQEKVVKEELGISSQGPLKPEEMNNYLAMLNDSATIITNPDTLPDNVIAKINDKDITYEEYFKHLLEVIGRDTVMQELVGYARDYAINTFLDDHNVIVDDAYVLDVERKLLQRNLDPQYKGKNLEEVLASANITSDEFVKRGKVRQRARMVKYLESTIIEDEKRDYFDNYINGKTVRTKHILISFYDKNGNYLGEDYEKEALQKASDIREKIVSGETSFEEMISRHSEDPSKMFNDGDTGFLHRKGDVVEEYAKKVFEMNVGEVSEPVKTQYGYHIIKVTEIEPAKNLNFEDYKNVNLMDIALNKLQSFASGLYQQTTIRIYAQNLPVPQ